MRERINTDIKTAMKGGEKDKVMVLRLINAALQTADIDAETKRKPKLTGPEVVAVLAKMVKQRRDSIDQFTKGGRLDLATKEQAEIVIIESYLPKQMDDAATKAAVAAAIAETGARDAKDMGHVMAALKQRHTGEMDFSKASTEVKEQLK